MPAGVIAAIIAGSATAGGQIYAARKQGQSADKAAALQTTASHDALAFQKEEAARDQGNFETTQHANYDQWAARESRMGALGEMVGLGPRTIPPYRSQGAQPPTGGAPGAGGASGPSAFLKGLLDKGVDPQAAAAQTNAQFKLTTGNEAKYYDASVHGTPVIGLPDSYIALENGKWNVTQRGGGGGAAAAPAAPAAPAATMTSLGSMVGMPQGNLSMPTPYSTLGSFATRR